MPVPGPALRVLLSLPYTIFGVLGGNAACARTSAACAAVCALHSLFRGLG